MLFNLLCPVLHVVGEKWEIAAKLQRAATLCAVPQHLLWSEPRVGGPLMLPCPFQKTGEICAANFQGKWELPVLNFPRKET